MSVPTTLAGWTAAGKPEFPAQPIADMVATFERHGYTVYWRPDTRHLEAATPEDHTPFSHTPWPGAQPYPLVMAFDLMPKDGDARSLAPIARRIIADKRSGRAPWIKYLNWTDEEGRVWHTKWQPDEVTSPSTDSGHIHGSIRTDYARSYAARGWDPTIPPPPATDEIEVPTMYLATDTDQASPTHGAVFLVINRTSYHITDPKIVSEYVNLHQAGAIKLGVDNGKHPDWWKSWKNTAGQDVAGVVLIGWRAEVHGPIDTGTVDVAALAHQVATELIAADTNGLTEADRASIAALVGPVVTAALGKLQLSVGQ
jgi:hypothetical protein